MLNSVSTSSSLPARLQSLPASLLPFVLCIYAVGFLLAYLAFLLDRRAAIQSVRDGVRDQPEVAAALRSPQTTFADRREALLAAAVWPALLVGTLLSPVWLGGWRHHELRSNADVQRMGGLAHP